MVSASWLAIGDVVMIVRLSVSREGTARLVRQSGRRDCDFQRRKSRIIDRGSVVLNRSRSGVRMGKIGERDKE